MCVGRRDRRRERGRGKGGRGEWGEVLELFSSRVSVDQDLSVIVAETINDDNVKQRLVPIVFHACVTRQRSAGSKTRLSCSHVHEKNK